VRDGDDVSIREKTGHSGLQMNLRPTFAIALILAAALPRAADAEDRLKLAVGQFGNWATSVAEVGQRGGVFRRHGLALELLYTQGSGETQQAVLSGGADIGVAVGVMGALSAYAKGAPVRIIGAETTGASDLYWYVRADSPIRRIEDFNGHSIAYSTGGSSTQAVVTAMVKQYGLKAKLVATGSPVATLTQVMSGQVDVGWASPPDGLDQLDRSEIRLVTNGNAASIFKDQTVRVLVTTAQTLDGRRDVITRFMRAYRETARWLYSDDAALKVYADWLGMSLAKARRARDEFFPWAALDPDTIVGLDALMLDAVDMKYIAAPLTRPQLSELIALPPQ
jgi:NitT/TauT family transport system substrate-binding protein